jgi:hypothetical protein
VAQPVLELAYLMPGENVLPHFVASPDS